MARAAAGERHSWRESWAVYADRRVLAILFLGFSSGLPIMLILTTLSAWLAVLGVDKGTIGLFGFAFAPYTFKFAWAPLLDRLPLPPLTTLLGRRRGWMLATQIGLIGAIFGLGQTDPSGDLWWTAFMAVLVAFFSASQDIVIDAYRIEALPPEKLGAGAGIYVLGYRIAMWIATAGALLLADSLGWSLAYAAMAMLVVVGIVTVLVVPEPSGSSTALVDEATLADDRLVRELAASRRDALRGPGGAILAVIVWLALLEPLSFLFGLFWPGQSAAFGLGPLAVLAGNAAMLGLGLFLAWRLWTLHPQALDLAKSYALLALAWAIIKILWYALASTPPYFGEIYGWLMLVLIGLSTNGVLGLLGIAPLPFADFTAPAWVMILSFWVEFFVLVAIYGFCYFSPRAIANFGPTPVAQETGVHLWMRRAVVEPFYDFFRRHGVAVAALILALISLFKASDVVLTLMANPFYLETGFSLTDIAWVSKTFGLWMTLIGGLLGGAIVFRLGLMRSLIVAVVAMALSNLMFVLLALSGPSIAVFIAVIVVENIAGGLGTAVFVAYLSSLCNVHYTAVQYALLTSFMQLFGKFVILPGSGFYAEAVGWVWFFASSALLSLPALLLLWLLWRRGLGVAVVAAEERQPA